MAKLHSVNKHLICSLSAQLSLGNIRLNTSSTTGPIRAEHLLLSFCYPLCLSFSHSLEASASVARTLNSRTMGERILKVCTPFNARTDHTDKEAVSE